MFDVYDCMYAVQLKQTTHLIKSNDFHFLDRSTERDYIKTKKQKLDKYIETIHSFDKHDNDITSEALRGTLILIE